MSRHRYPIATLVTVLLFTTGCAQRSASPTPASSTAARPTVTVERTGGLAGGHLTMVVEPNGDWTRSDKRRGHLASGTLTDNQQRQLQELVTDPRLRNEAERSPVTTTCRDAFNYRVSVGQTEINYVDCPTDQNLPQTARAIVALVESATNA